jgi:MarR family transcriptional regulator, lower aerobic nicotinate degradation pathway regulator
MPTVETDLKLPKAGLSRELLSSTPFLLKRLGWVVKERAHEALEETGLQGHHHAVLSLLEEGTRETQRTIADALGYDRSQLVGLLDELEEQGLVERRRDPKDRRCHVVSVTPAGKDALIRLRTVLERVQEDLLAPLNVEQRETLHALLLELAGHQDERFVPKLTA